MDGAGIKLGEIERHFWLTRSVAKVVGVNLSEEMAIGSISPADYSEMVTRCRAGGCDEICQQWLARQTGRDVQAPPHCAHRDVLNQLRRHRAKTA